MKGLWQITDFLQQVRRERRFGELSRAPLDLMRLELRGVEVECDWIAREADPFDASLKPVDQDRHVSEQALRDAIAVRELLFASLPKLERAVLRVFRRPGSPVGAREPPDLVIYGLVSRDAPPVFRVNSLVMRAKLYGFEFRLSDGVLDALGTVQDIGFEVIETTR